MPETNPPFPPGVLTSWGHHATSGRGRRPSVDLNDIVSAATELADHEGLSGVSMPRVAQRIGLTQNALYRYVVSKEELLVLMADAAYGEPPQLDESASWRAAVRGWVDAAIARYLAHPWLLEIRLRAPITRNNVRWTEALLRALRGSGLHLDQRVECAQLVDGHARYAAALARDIAEQQDSGYDDTLTAMLAPMLREADCSDYAEFLATATLTPPIARSASEGTDFGLERILDGVEGFVAQHITTGRSVTE